jgi:hypothetical protein
MITADEQRIMDEYRRIREKDRRILEETSRLMEQKDAARAAGDMELLDHLSAEIDRLSNEFEYMESVGERLRKGEL